MTQAHRRVAALAITKRHQRRALCFISILRIYNEDDKSDDISMQNRCQIKLAEEIKKIVALKLYLSDNFIRTILSNGDSIN